MGQQVVAFGSKADTKQRAPAGLRLTSPASRSTVVIYVERARTHGQLSTLVCYGAVLALATALCLLLAQPIARGLGKTGINFLTRLLGLIAAALAVDVMSDGLVKLFPVPGK